MKQTNMITQLIELSQKAEDEILTGEFMKARLSCHQIVKISGDFLN